MTRVLRQRLTPPLSRRLKGKGRTRRCSCPTLVEPSGEHLGRSSWESGGNATDRAGTSVQPVELLVFAVGTPHPLLIIQGENVARSLSQVNTQIAKLQRLADSLKAKEATLVISRIRKAIDHYGLTASDLGLGVAHARRGRPPGRPAGRKPAKRSKSRASGVIKFRDDSGNSWTGHGRSPSWYKLALASGKTPDDLRVE